MFSTVKKIHRKVIRKKQLCKGLFEIRTKEYKYRDRAISTDYDLGNNVKLYYWKLEDNNSDNVKENLGDYLSTIVVRHFISHSTSNKERSSTTLYGIGSILGFRCQNAVVWGSGILNTDKEYLYRIKLSNLDIRAVRGPKTREQLVKLGKDCPCVFGDPAVLLPYIYMPNETSFDYEASLILHHSDDLSFEIPQELQINIISIKTRDYESFISQIVKSKRVISSSLHGIILAETYNIPAVLLLKEGHPLFKYEDWYKSTGREEIVVAHSIEEALKIDPMPIPDLHTIQEDLIKAFPKDLWE